MRMARIAASVCLSCFISGCQYIPQKIKGPDHAVAAAPGVAYPNCLGDSSSRFSYRKRVLFTRLDVKNRQHLRGLYGIESRFIDSLSEHLDRNRYDAITRSDIGLSDIQAVDLHGKVMRIEKKISNLAAQYRAQFVVAGEIIDLGQQTPRSVFSRNYRSVPIVSDYTDDPKRMIVIRLDIYEAVSGELLDRETFSAWSKDDADLNQQVSLMGEYFMQTSLGVALQGVLDQQNNYVSGLLSCIPLQGQVLRMAAAEQAVLSVGASQGLRPGDSFKVYRNNESAGVHDLEVSQRAIGELTVNEVYPDYALGALSDDSGASLRQGDWVRAW